MNLDNDGVRSDVSSPQTVEVASLLSWRRQQRMLGGRAVDLAPGLLGAFLHAAVPPWAGRPAAVWVGSRNVIHGIQALGRAWAMPWT